MGTSPDVVVARHNCDGEWVLGEVGRDTGGLLTWIHWPDGRSELVDRPRLRRFIRQGERAQIELAAA